MAEISLRPEVVVNDIQNDRESALMTRIDQRAKIVRRAVGMRGREEHHAVVAPVALARPIGHRHNFQRGDTERNEIIEPLDRADKRARFRERADVAFVNHLPGVGGPRPVLRAPFKIARIHNLRGAEDALRLIMRREIGNRRRAIDGNLVEIAHGAARIEAEEVAGVLRLFERHAIFLAARFFHLHHDA